MNTTSERTLDEVLSTDPDRLTHLVCPSVPPPGGRAICGWLCVGDGPRGPMCAVCDDLRTKPCSTCGQVHEVTP